MRGTIYLPVGVERGGSALNEIGDKALAENVWSGDCPANRVEDCVERYGTGAEDRKV